jgi:hypothetical protein
MKKVVKAKVEQWNKSLKQTKTQFSKILDHTEYDHSTRLFCGRLTASAFFNSSASK